MDSSFFLLYSIVGVIWILVYLDDLIFTSNNKLLLDQFIVKLNTQFSLKDLRPLNFFLCTKLHKTHMVFHLSQESYITYLLNQITILNSKLSPSPASMFVQLGAGIGTLFHDLFLYRSTIGAL